MRRDETLRTSSRHLTRGAVSTVGLGLFAAAMWFAWLGWDHDYYFADGQWQGPYRAWQVLGCGSTIAAASVVAQLGVRSTWSCFVLPAAAVIGLAVPWAVDAAATDESGLWAVGLVLLLVGGWIGLTLLLTVAHAVATRLRQRGART